MVYVLCMNDILCSIRIQNINGFYLLVRASTSQSARPILDFSVFFVSNEKKTDFFISLKIFLFDLKNN